MAAMKSGTDDYWRNYFRTAKSDIFGIIEQAIMVAASDCPKEFRLRRDRIAEMLFSCKMTRCSGCERVELAVPGNDDEEGGGYKSGGCEFDVAGGGKESKENSTSKIDHHHHQGEMNMNHVSNYSYLEAEALTDELEEVNQHFQEVLRIKQLLENSADQSDSVVFECLQRLQLMNLTVPTLKATEIGKTVNEMRRHGSIQIRNLAKPLIALWKGMVDEWVITTQAIAAAAAEGTPESVNPSGLDEEEEEEEEGLPSPPMDEAFFATQTAAPMELGQFFDVFDEDGNLRNSGDVTKNRENGRRPSLEKQNIAKRKEQPLNVANTPPKDNKVQQMKRQEAVLKPKLNKPLNTESGPGRPPRVNVESRISNETKYKQKPKVSLQERTLTPQEKLKCSDEAAVRMKLEATKRKLQERYQEAENAKKQRTVQVMELQDIPKQGFGHRNPHMKPGSQNRHRANGRR